MNGHSDACTPSGIADAVRTASDFKGDQSDFITVLSTTSIVSLVLVGAVAALLIVELTWRERRWRRQREQETPPSGANRRKGET
ncbi:hypothetical protein ACFV1X_26205 [Streptomyces coelicoflavus]|uniref:hypothetical protein n=1 Tax=Streptomyces coelicoflavus TaxID=285562 RepID=UPI0036A32668